ncbi:MAG: restriction endonuclease subunit S [Nostoc sp.]|uniref:restriction endonuclease subunit S n=1 Tax=Nostoc sp. TaxID=1180 RepID=UPI002FF8A953
MSHPVKQLLKYVGTINDETLKEDTDSKFELKYVDIGNVDSKGKIHDFATYLFDNAPSRARRIVRDGDIIISTVRTYLQAIAPIQSPPDNLIVSTGFAVIRPKREKLDSGYCKYAFRESRFLDEVMARSVGVSYPAINASELGNIPIYVPSLFEQRAIANYLDRETTKIDTLISARERLLDLLTEKRRALITHAVTRGLNPDVSLQNSSFEFFKYIPEHWEVINLKFLGDVRTGVTKGRNFGNRETVLVPYFRVANVQDGYLDLSDIAQIEVLPEEISSFKLEKGDVLGKLFVNSRIQVNEL